MMTKDVVAQFLSSVSGGNDRQLWRVGFSTTAKIVKEGKEVSDREYDMIIVGTIEQVIRWVRARGGEIQYFSAFRIETITDVSGGK